MRDTRAGRSRTGWMLAVWLCMALVIAPAHANAAPLAQPAVYEDPDGRFTLPNPEEFPLASEVTYEMAGDNPLEGLIASTGYGFRTPEPNNSVAVIFLLLDQEITDEADFAAFLERFQTAAGGETLPLVEMELFPGETLRGGGSVTTRERFLQVELQAEGDVVSVLTASVERSRRSELRGAIDEVFAGFTWSPELVRASLASAEPAGRQEPVSPAPDSGRFADPEGVFSLVVPPGLTAEWENDEESGSYLYSFYAADNQDAPVVAAAFIPVAYALDEDPDGPTFRDVSDEEWTRFVDEYLLQDAGLSVVADRRDDFLRTAYLELGAADLGEGLRLWAWVEETDGVAALVISMDAGENPAAAETFHTALTSLTWSPARARAAIAGLMGMPDPAAAPVPFADPLGLIGMTMPPDYPFQSVSYDEDSLNYSFGTNPIEGIVLVTLSDTGEGSFSPDEWQEIVTTVEGTLVDTLTESGLGRNPALLPTEMGMPDVGADNAALMRAASDLFQMAVVVLEYDGILVTQVYILPDAYWQVSEAVVRAGIDAGMDLDPAAVREAINAYLDLGVMTLGTTMTDVRPGPDQDPEPLYRFAPDSQIIAAIQFAESDLDGALNAVITRDELPEHPLALSALDLSGEAVNTFDLVALQDGEGTRAAFVYQPDYPTTPGSYTARLYYEGVPVAAHRFIVEDNPPAQTEISNLGVYYGDGAAGEPILITRAIHPQDVVNVRGTGDLPPDATLRLFWYDPDGGLVSDEVLTIRIESSSHSMTDWFVFNTWIDWQPGVYSYLLTLNGETVASGELSVVEATAEVELTPDGAEVFANLPLPADLEIAPVVEGIDLAVVSTAEYDAEQIVSTVDAWLRMQGWQPALPQSYAPLAWDFRRYTKDGYQFALEPGEEGRENEVWMSYAPVAEGAFGWLPAGEPLTADNLDVLAEVAALQIPGVDVAEAVLSPDGNWLAATTTDGRLYFVDAHRLMDAMWWSSGSAYYANPTFSPDSRELAVTVQLQSRSQIQVFHNLDVVWLPTALLAGHTGEVTGLAFQPSGLLASGSADGGLRWWDVSGVTLPLMRASAGSVTSIAPAPAEEPGLLVGLEGGEVEFWVEGGDLWWTGLGTLTTSPQVSVWPALDEGGVGDLAVYGQGQAEWYAYDTSGADLVADVPEDNPDFTSTGAAFGPDGSLLIIAGPYAGFYDRVAGEALGTRQSWTADEALAQIVDLSISEDGVFAVLVTDDGLVRLWAAAAQ